MGAKRLHSLIFLSMLAVAVAVLFAGCGRAGLSREAYDAVRLGQPLEQAQQQLGDPGRGVELLRYVDRWVYIDRRRDLRMVVFFDADRKITAKQWWRSGQLLAHQP